MQTEQVLRSWEPHKTGESVGEKKICQERELAYLKQLGIRAGLLTHIQMYLQSHKHLQNINIKSINMLLDKTGGRDSQEA